MRNPLKENIKSSFIEFLPLWNHSKEIREEVTDVLRYHIAVHSCALENDSIPPWFLYNNNNNGNNHRFDSLMPEYHNLKLESESLFESYKFLSELSQSKTYLTPEILLKIHHSIYERSRYNIAGKFRNKDNGDVINGVALPRFSLIPEQMEQNLLWLCERMKYIGVVTADNFFEIFHLAAEIQLRLIVSSPFNYGNSIIARLVSDYILINSSMFNNVILYDTKKEYLKAIRESSFENSAPLADFLIKSFDKTFKQILLFYKQSKKSSDISKI